jgi:hypothetical protein
MPMMAVFHRRGRGAKRTSPSVGRACRCRSHRRLILLFVIAAGAGLLAQRDPLPFSMADADRLDRTLAAIAQLGVMSTRPGSLATQVRVTIREPEVNAYLRYRSREQLPVGVIDPSILVLGDGRLAGRADVDLDAVREARERSLFDPLRFLRGRMPVSATGVLTTKNGIGRFELESATASGVPIPKALLQELITFYWGTAANPVGFNLDAPFDLPMGIREIQVGAGQAVIVQ